MIVKAQNFGLMAKVRLLEKKLAQRANYVKMLCFSQTKRPLVSAIPVARGPKRRKKLG